MAALLQGQPGPALRFGGPKRKMNVALSTFSNTRQLNWVSALLRWALFTFSLSNFTHKNLLQELKNMKFQKLVIITMHKDYYLNITLHAF